MSDNYSRIRRATHDKDNPYFMMRRTTAQHKGLSFEARGMLAYLLSKPDTWIVMLSDLQENGDCGRDKVRRILHELETHGYLKRERTNNDKGEFIWEHVVYEVPHAPSTGKPSVVKPSVVNHPLDNTDEHTTEAGNATPLKRKPQIKKATAQVRKEQVLADPYYIAYCAVAFPPTYVTQTNASQFTEVIDALKRSGVTPEQVQRYVAAQKDTPRFVWLSDRVGAIQKYGTPFRVITAPVANPAQAEEKRRQLELQNKAANPAEGDVA